MPVKGPPEFVQDPLSNCSNSLLLDVGAEGADDRDEDHGKSGELKDGQSVLTYRGDDHLGKPGGYFLCSQHTIKNNLQRPRLQEASSSFRCNGKHPYQQSFPMRPKQVKQRDAFLFLPLTFCAFNWHLEPSLLWSFPSLASNQLCFKPP